MVCIPRFNLSSDLPPPGGDPFFPECGYCVTCFMTEEPFFEFEQTHVTRLNATYLALVCEVESNVDQFMVAWQITDEEGGEQTTIRDRDLIEGNPVRVRTTSSRTGSMTSILTAPDIVLEQDIQCMATSEFGSQSSDVGAFEEGNLDNTDNVVAFCSSSLLSHSDLEELSEPFPVWAIALIAITCALMVVCLVATAALSCGIFYSCCHTRIRNYDAASIQRYV